MKVKFYSAIFTLLLLVAPLSHAVLPLPDTLKDFTSVEGQKYLEKSLEHSRHEKKINSALKLLSNFTTQDTQTFCGVASLVTILNSSNLDKPLDTEHSKLNPPPPEPPQPMYYFTQHDFFKPEVEKIWPREKVEKNGLTLDQLAKIANDGFGLPTKAYHAVKGTRDPNEIGSASQLKKVLIEALSNNQFVIVNFLRNGMSPGMGGGHHSPLAAYDGGDRFLILDVARYKYPSYWVKTEDLWNGINTPDGDTKPEINRGILVLSNKSN